MGGWLEVLRRRPPPDDDDESRRRPFIVGEIGCHPLVRASLCLGREHRGEFPALARVCAGSSAYDGERLWLDDHHAKELLAEFQRVRRIGRWQEFLAGLDGRRYYDRWREGEAPEEFEDHLDRIEAVLAAAESGGWIHLSL